MLIVVCTQFLTGKGEIDDEQVGRSPHLLTQEDVHDDEIATDADDAHEEHDEGEDGVHQGVQSDRIRRFLSFTVVLM